MANKRIQRQTYILALVFTIIQEILTNPAKDVDRPVHEIINENSRADVDIDELTHTNPSLPYGNPLAGNSQRAKQYALNQQAMFNAEKIRQHRAQLQRWTKAPQQIDSYMKAYQESQENHQLALETLQGGIINNTPPKTGDGRVLRAVTDLPQTKSTVKTRRDVKPKEAIKFTSEDAIKNKSDKNRDHRSHGSLKTNSVQYETVHLSPKRNYEQGVTIKPHGNAGLPALNLQIPESTQETNLYTEAIASNIQYIYPKQDRQKQFYKSAQDIGALNSLLKNGPQGQLTHSNVLLDLTKTNNEDVKSLNQPIDLFFYLKDAGPQTFPHHYIPQESDSNNGQKPITEAIDDIENPHTVNTKMYGFENHMVTEQPKDITTKNNNYYKLEAESETISGLKPAYHSQIKQPLEFHVKHQEDKPTYSLKFVQRPNLKGIEDLNEKYLQNAHFGVHHLNEDATGTSTYDFDNLQYASNYEFGYRVHDHHSGNDFGHSEIKEGEDTKGFYHVLLPDGRMQKVKYHAGPHGYHADISYDHLQRE